jgi:hypothetical protein
MAYINIETNEYPLTENEIRLANPNISYPAIFAADGYVWVFSKPQPVIDPITQYVAELPPVEINGHYEQAWEVLSFSAEIIAENQAAEALRIAQRIESNKAALWQAAHDYEYASINGVAIGMLTLGVIQGLPKSLAVKAWTQALWNLYYERKALIVVVLDADLLDFSIVGNMPYSIPELMAELGV